MTADGNNHISAFAYDASGNASSDGTFAYTWDAESQMKTAAGVTYSYDGDGRRVMKSNGKIYWYGSGGEILAETDAAGNTLNEYIFFGGQRIAMLPSGASSLYYVEDFLGSSRVITQSNGVPCYDADFDPFSGEHAYTNTCPQNYKFEGKERDTETGNDDFGARYYSNRFGRWLSADWSAVPVPVPYANLTNPQTLNLYSMVSDDPESFADLDGHCVTPLSFIACVVVGAAAAAYGVYELNKKFSERGRVENQTFNQSYDCAINGKGCTTNEKLRQYDKEHVNTYGEGAISAIENTVPDATPPTTITGVVVDQAKGKGIDAMVDSAKKDGQRAPDQSTQKQQKPSFWRRVANFFSPPPPPPRPQPPPPPPCGTDKDRKC